MSTGTAHNSPGAARRTTLSLLVALGLIALQFVSTPSTSRTDAEQFEGRAPTAAELTPSVGAAFPHQSYAPGETASLVFFNSAAGVMLRVFHTGPEHATTIGNNEMLGVPMTDPFRVGTVHAGSVTTLTIGDWPSGVYFARVAAADGRVGFAPFVLRPRHLGEHRVAVVLPTLTWQAYNLRDDDGDGTGDTWYADWHTRTARLGRPFLNCGVPPHFRPYDLRFLHWLAWNNHQVDYLSDADLDTAAGGRALAAAYDLIIFPGHHEYVTSHEYDAVEQYRNLGGNLAFLSANNFFRRVDIHGNQMTLIGLWRDLGRPEASLIGVQYLSNDNGKHRGPWVVRNFEAVPWLFHDTGLRDGRHFVVTAGTEIDHTAASSPEGVRVIADIKNLFGPGLTAQMTYYETSGGARVFAAGAFTLAGSANKTIVSQLLDNLWTHLTEP
jgi:hypothetical protein